jgi:GNAT superfamily N-acetyltransferase
MIKKYKITHNSLAAANKHIDKIKARGGHVKKTLEGNNIILEYYFLEKSIIKSKFDLEYIKDTSLKGYQLFNVNHKNNFIGIIEFHKIKNQYIEIDRIYLEKKYQKKGYGQKIIYDILNFTKSKGFRLYPLDQTPWLKMGLTFVNGEYPYMGIRKVDFIKHNKQKINR